MSRTYSSHSPGSPTARPVYKVAVHLMPGSHKLALGSHNAKATGLMNRSTEQR